MQIINIIMAILLIANVNGYVLNKDDEDPILDMLLGDDYINNKTKESKEVPKDEEQIPVFVNGVWLCGNCSNISEINLLYNESYDVETTYHKKRIELEIGFSMDNMRCIKIDAEENAKVEIVSGACAGDSVTFKMTNTNHCCGISTKNNGYIPVILPFVKYKRNPHRV